MDQNEILDEDQSKGNTSRGGDVPPCVPPLEELIEHRSLKRRPCLQTKCYNAFDV
jgi:hypothetical protein